MIKHKPSTKFWFIILIIGLITLGFINLEALGIVEGMLSIAALVVMSENTDPKGNDLWLFLTITFWFLAMIAFIGLGVHWIYTKTITKFNEYLDSKYGSNNS